MKFPTHAVLFFLFSVITFSSEAQQFSPPLRISPALSANFGELRNNHFHSGLDYKTQQTINKPVYSIDDGYVSRINVSPGGFGLALYITHPSGHTSVYGHLNSYSQKIAEYVKAKQYEKESFRVDVMLKPNEIPVKKGEQVAMSGNSGSSGGPHLHFEIRDTKTEEPLDPLVFLSKSFHDTQKPEIRGIAFYPEAGKGTVNGSNKPIHLGIGRTKSGDHAGLGTVINGWGSVGVGVKAYDKMNGVSNTYGVKNIRLYVDGNRVFSSRMTRFSFDKTRTINSFIDFDEWRQNKSFYMKSFVEPGNTLPIYETLNNGYININAEKDYKVRYELEDSFGNMVTYSFVIKGKKQPIQPHWTCTNYMTWNLNNRYFDTDFSLNIPIGNLYDDFCYTHRKTPSTKYFSDIHRVNNKSVPLNRNAQIWLKLKNTTVKDSTKYGIVEIDKSGKESWIGGNYKRGGVEASISELGSSYGITVDTIPPVITPQQPAQWVANRRITIILQDEKSGISFSRGTIDGKFALFTNDVKSKIYTYVFDDTRLTRGKSHELIFTATDGAGNKTEYRYQFVS